jgi:AcrR family transcriptional regulator
MATQEHRRRNPRGQGDRLRADIIEAASRLLADPAAPPLTLRGVARAAGVAATSVYLHFADTDELVLAVADQLDQLSFEAFFEDTMFHEVAHGLGVKNTINGKGLARKALREYAGGFEEGKADILGLHLITKLSEKGELDKSKLMDCYVTSLASLLRSVRFGASDAHGKANMVRFNFFMQQGAFSRDPASGRYRVDFANFQKAMELLSGRLLTVQGDGDYAMAKQMTDTLGVIGPELAADLKRLETARVPIDIVFEQGLEVLGLTKP